MSASVPAKAEGVPRHEARRLIECLRDPITGPVHAVEAAGMLDAMLRERGVLRQRVSQAEKAMRTTVEDCKRQGVSFGRLLANYAASMFERERDEARAELAQSRDATATALLREVAHWRAEAVALRQHLGLHPAALPPAEAQPEPFAWYWGSGEDAEEFYGGLATRGEAIAAALLAAEPGEVLAIVRARPRALRFDAITAYLILELFVEHNAESWGEDGPTDCATSSQEAELAASVTAAIEAWNRRHRVYRAWILDIPEADTITAPGGEADECQEAGAAFDGREVPA